VLEGADFGAQGASYCPAALVHPDFPERALLFYSPAATLVRLYWFEPTKPMEPSTDTPKPTRSFFGEPFSWWFLASI
jgi:hypothetical protein